MQIPQFSIAPRFKKNDPCRDFRDCWEILANALSNEEMRGAELTEVDDGDVFDCLISDIELKHAIRISRKLARIPAVYAALDWYRPFAQNNEMVFLNGGRSAGRFGADGVFTSSDGEAFPVFRGVPGNPMKSVRAKKRLLITADSGTMSAERTAREIIRLSGISVPQRDVVIFPAGKELLPDILLYQNDLRLRNVTLENGTVLRTAVRPDGTALIGCADPAAQLAAVESLRSPDLNRFLIETDQAFDSVPEGVETVLASEHLANLLRIQRFSVLTRNCRKTVLAVPEECRDQLEPLISESNLSVKFCAQDGSEERLKKAAELLFE